MHSDRGVSLILQAAAKGLIDFSKARLSDRKWWIKLDWLLNELENENYRSVIALRFNQQVALLNYLSTEEQYTAHWDRSSNLIVGYHNTLFPWNPQKQVQDRVQDNYNQMADQWRDAWGDPKDPETAKKIQETCDFLANLGKKK